MLEKGLILKSINCGDACDYDDNYIPVWVYSIYCFKNHYFKYTSEGKFTSVSQGEKEQAEKNQGLAKIFKLIYINFLNYT